MDFKSWADEQLKKLRLDQQGMRERAEKQWADIDRIREERHNANLGVTFSRLVAVFAHCKHLHVQQFNLHTPGVLLLGAS